MKLAVVILARTNQEAWKKFPARGDLRFLWIDKEYGCTELFLPNKKKDLSSERKVQNQAIVSVRIIVGHRIGDLKRIEFCQTWLQI